MATNDASQQISRLGQMVDILPVGTWRSLYSKAQPAKDGAPLHTTHHIPHHTGRLTAGFWQTLDQVHAHITCTHCTRTPGHTNLTNPMAAYRL
jgi:hypothetical protein